MKPSSTINRVIIGLAAIFMLAISSASRADTVEHYPTCAAPARSSTAPQTANPETINAIVSRARPGEVIQLVGGNYPPLDLSRSNANFVTIEPLNNQRPVFPTITIRGSYWTVRGVSVTGLSPATLESSGWQHHNPLIRVQSGANIILEGNEISSTTGPYPWTPERAGQVEKMPLSDGVNVYNSSCVTISHNHVFNVFNGILAGGDQQNDNGKYFNIVDNRIEDFAGDGIDHYGSYMNISRNRINDGHDICENKCIHMDAIQGWNYHTPRKVVNNHVIIDSNYIVQQSKPKLELPADALQGITIFDGNWDDVRVSNNVVIVDAWHGIALYGPQNSSVVNNTVIANTDRQTWIMITAKKPDQGGDIPRNVFVRNNIATNFRIGFVAGKPGEGVIEEHNLTLGNPKSIFRTFDIRAAQYDLHLKPHTPAVAAGALDRSAGSDIEGKPRAERADLGAYKFEADR